jgi:Ca2+-binding EF-hand superfamily protein
MKRNEIVSILINEGFSEKTLVNFSDKQLTTLASRILSEQTTTPTLKVPKNSPQEKDAMNKKQSFIAYENELKGGQKKLDKNHNGKIDAQDFKILRGQKGKQETKESLVGGQKKIDKNHNGKIDAQDFKILRGKKVETKESNEKWIQKAINPAKKGALKKALHVPQDEKIPVSKLNAAAKKGGKLGQRARFAKTLRKLDESNSELNAKRNLQYELSEAGCSDSELNTKDIHELGEKYSKKSQGVRSAHDHYKRVTGKDMSKINENLAIKNWVRTLAENNYHSFTSKKEIMNLISEKMNTTETMTPMPSKARKGHNGIPEFMTYDSIKSSSSPAVAPTKPKVTPGTKPAQPTKPKKTPFRPTPQVQPNPEAMRENEPAVAPTKPKTKPSTKPAEPTKPKKTPFRPTPQVQPNPEAKRK